jgi:hypothetical protein
MRTGNPLIAQAGAEWVWDLGGNMTDYTWPSGGGIMATRTYAQGTGTERGSQIAVAEAADRYNYGWPLLETDDLFSSENSFAVLQSHADGQLAGLSLPLVRPKLTVEADIAPILGEYSVGDFGRMVIPPGLDDFHPAGLDLPIRLTTIEVTIDTEGRESVVLTCRPEVEVS